MGALHTGIADHGLAFGTPERTHNLRVLFAKRSLDASSTPAAQKLTQHMQTLDVVRLETRVLTIATLKRLRTERTNVAFCFGFRETVNKMNLFS